MQVPQEDAGVLGAGAAADLELAADGLDHRDAGLAGLAVLGLEAAPAAEIAEDEAQERGRLAIRERRGVDRLRGRGAARRHRRALAVVVVEDVVALGAAAVAGLGRTERDVHAQRRADAHHPLAGPHLVLGVHVEEERRRREATIEEEVERHQDLEDGLGLFPWGSPPSVAESQESYFRRLEIDLVVEVVP